jgi:hypothetical protein
MMRQQLPRWPRTYKVAVYFQDDDGAWRPHGTWEGPALTALDARLHALDALADVRIEGWKAEVLTTAPAPRRLQEFDPCPTDGCGRELHFASPSGAYLNCTEGHVHATRTRCQEPGCRRLATSFLSSQGGSRKAFCTDHDTWPHF